MAKLPLRGFLLGGTQFPVNDQLMAMARLTLLSVGVDGFIVGIVRSELQLS